MGMEFGDIYIMVDYQTHTAFIFLILNTAPNTQCVDCFLLRRGDFPRHPNMCHCDSVISKFTLFVVTASQ